MVIQEQVVDTQERIGFRLRELYSGHGYGRYRMSKFEEYDLYSRNKDFLFSEGVITFTDTNGRLMALKPDVTLSIVKNAKDRGDGLNKLYYHENVYRVSDAEEGFREQTQVGLECMGGVDADCVAEVLALAADSLERCSEQFVLEVSHLGILRKIVEAVTPEESLQRQMLVCAGEKNLHGISRICREGGVAEGAEEPLLRLLSLYGTPESVIPELRKLAEETGTAEEAEELADAVLGFRGGETGRKIRIDFSATGDMRYYNGIIFRGFISGIPGSVLSGGQYDTLMKRMGRKDRAIGFAVFLNMLERLTEEGRGDA